MQRNAHILLTALLTVATSVRAAETPLSTVAEIRHAPDTAYLTQQPFDLTGEVISNGRLHWFFRDGTGGLQITNRRVSDRSFAREDVVRVRGTLAITENGTRTPIADRTTFIGAGTPSVPVETNSGEVNSGRMDYRIVRIRGVIASVVRDEVDIRLCWATLRTPDGALFLTLYEKWNDPALIRTFVDADVSVIGLAAPITGLRRNLGHCIAVDDFHGITLLAPPPTDPFDAPDLSRPRVSHRQKTRGTVLAADARRFFLRTEIGRVIPVTPDLPHGNRLPRSGDLVTVVGFATDDPYRTQLSDALFRIDGRDTNATVRAGRRTLRSLFQNDRGDVSIGVAADGTFVTVQGTALSVNEQELRISDGPHSLTIDLDTLQALGIPPPPDDSTVSASGLCLTEFETPSIPAIYPTFKRFVLVPRDASDLVVLKTPSWWTPFRLTMLVIVLATILVSSVLWNVTLKRKSERRGKELYEEKIDHALAEQKVEERTRLAVELHDSVSQTLTGVALQLDGGETETAKTMLASCRGELRRCLWDLRSRTFEEKDMTEAVTRTIAPHLNGIEANVRFNVPRERLSESLTHAILRIIRELVVNAIRHGHAKHVRIAGEMHDNTVSFSVSDDGCGFTPEAAPGPEQGHFGLLGIRERIEDFDGQLKIAAEPDHGAKFIVTLITTDEANEH